MEYNNYILIEYDIGKSIGFKGGIYGTMNVLVDAANLFGNRYLKNKIKIGTVVQETHELFWQKDSMEVTKSSNVSVQNIIPLTKIQNMQTMIFL